MSRLNLTMSRVAHAAKKNAERPATKPLEINLEGFSGIESDLDDAFNYYEEAENVADRAQREFNSYKTGLLKYKGTLEKHAQILRVKYDALEEALKTVADLPEAKAAVQKQFDIVEELNMNVSSMTMRVEETIDRLTKMIE